MILDSVASQLAACTLELSKLPPLNAADPVTCVYTLITELCTSMKESIVGSPVNADLVQATRETYEDFKFTIRSSAPPFAPYKNAREAPHNVSEYASFDPNVTAWSDGEGILFLENVRDILRGSVDPSSRGVDGVVVDLRMG